MNNGNCSGTQQTLHLLRAHVHNCLPPVPETRHTALHNSAKSVALHNVTFMTGYFTVRSCYTTFNPFAGGSHLVSYPQLLIQYLQSCSPRGGGHLFSNCNMTLCHTVEATECWKTRIKLCSSETLTEVSKEECLMGCDTTLLGKWFVTLWRNMSTLSSWTDYLWRWRWHNPSKHWNHSPSDTLTQQKTRILDTTFFGW